MSSVLNVKLNKKPCYDIMFEKSFQALGPAVKELGFAGTKCCIITDSSVGPLYAEKVTNQLKKAFFEKEKNLNIKKAKITLEKRK